MLCPRWSSHLFLGPNIKTGPPQPFFAILFLPTVFSTKVEDSTLLSINRYELFPFFTERGLPPGFLPLIYSLVFFFIKRVLLKTMEARCETYEGYSTQSFFCVALIRDPRLITTSGFLFPQEFGSTPSNLLSTPLFVQFI